ncbi:hypothetical protein M0G74_08860 [Microbulbifer sp. CAU 1566]|uniref:hypothetical protein n=1 Tax=unclassified Microbulbifer TaxID=2619833 RepID=UPI001359B060|nr:MULTISPECIES: hypothetical protein [unclassified Microbulbifer]MCK7597375.1 hypothetical protein [Microbulbifer sp. CAU 1566]
MRYKTLEDVIQEGREFHLKLSRQYEEFEVLSANERACLLLDQLKRREVSMMHTLENFREDIGDGALHTWVQFAPEGREPEFLQRLRNIDVSDVEAIGQLAMDIEIYLADQYRDLLLGADTPSAKHALERLLELEQLEEHTLSMNLFNLRDY